jgi:hypothetical protein
MLETKNRTTKTIFDAIEESFCKDGDNALHRLAENNPAEYLNIILKYLVELAKISKSEEVSSSIRKVIEEFSPLTTQIMSELKLK